MSQGKGALTVVIVPVPVGEEASPVFAKRLLNHHERLAAAVTRRGSSWSRYRLRRPWPSRARQGAAERTRARGVLSALSRRQRAIGALRVWGRTISPVP
jgi:hypothetical protein